MYEQIIRDGYDRAARKYLNERDSLKSGKFVNKLLQRLQKNSLILDLGCGAGVPVDDTFLKHNHNVIGIDSSPEMIRLAKKNCKRGEYSVRDIASLKYGEYEADAILSLYALFHLPRDTHGELLKIIASNINKNGWILITMGDKEFEGFTEFYNEKMWWSHWSPATNRKLVKNAGFEIIIDEMDASGREKHQIILAQKVS